MVHNIRSTLLGFTSSGFIDTFLWAAIFLNKFLTGLDDFGYLVV